MHRVASTLALFALASCTSAAADPCGTCAEGAFCCLTTCQALGTVCGTDDAARGDAATTLPDAALDASIDAPLALDASFDPCATDGGATPIASACVPSIPGSLIPDPGVLHCSDGSTDACGNLGHCVDWTDAAGARHGVCAGHDQTSTCDPAHDTWECVGSVERACVANPPSANIGDAPPGWWGESDCRPHWSADATCALGTDGVARCTSPTDVPCDPSTFVIACDQACMDAPGTAMGGVIRPFCTGAHAMCVSTTLTTEGVTCVPIGATPSTQPATTSEVGLACEPGGGIRMEAFGYEWSQACEPAYHVVGGTLTSVPTTCWRIPDGSGAYCLAPEQVTCTSETVAATCADGTHSTQCDHWLQTTRDCSTSGISASICDPATGMCAFTPPCHLGWPFTETCAGPDHKWTIGDCSRGVATLAPCTGCHASPTGDGVVCG